MGMNAASLRAFIAQRQNATVKNDAPTQNDTTAQNDTTGNNVTEKENELLQSLQIRSNFLRQASIDSMNEGFNRFS